MCGVGAARSGCQGCGFARVRPGTGATGHEGTIRILGPQAIALREQIDDS